MRLIEPKTKLVAVGRVAEPIVFANVIGHNRWILRQILVAVIHGTLKALSRNDPLSVVGKTSIVCMRHQVSSVFIRTVLKVDGEMSFQSASPRCSVDDKAMQRAW